MAILFSSRLRKILADKNVRAPLAPAKKPAGDEPAGFEKRFWKWS